MKNLDQLSPFCNTICHTSDQKTTLISLSVFQTAYPLTYRFLLFNFFLFKPPHKQDSFYGYINCCDHLVNAKWIKLYTVYIDSNET